MSLMLLNFTKTSQATTIAISLPQLFATWDDTSLSFSPSSISSSSSSPSRFTPWHSSSSNSPPSSSSSSSSSSNSLSSTAKSRRPHSRPEDLSVYDSDKENIPDYNPDEDEKDDEDNVVTCGNIPSLTCCALDPSIGISSFTTARAYNVSRGDLLLGWKRRRPFDRPCSGRVVKVGVADRHGFWRSSSQGFIGGGGGGDGSEKSEKNGKVNRSGGAKEDEMEEMDGEEEMTGVMWTSCSEEPRQSLKETFDVRRLCERAGKGGRDDVVLVGGMESEPEPLEKRGATIKDQRRGRGQLQPRDLVQDLVQRQDVSASGESGANGILTTKTRRRRRSSGSSSSSSSRGAGSNPTRSTYQRAAIAAAGAHPTGS
ncbi:MAG: hypothetical protein M1825_003251 [Sarcosagium campestre]|nr:MAG: hypothetical protein M1825_003251 [Sarcosagium campestre]